MLKKKRLGECKITLRIFKMIMKIKLNKVEEIQEK